VACRPGELSQQPTWPQLRQSRRWTQRPPLARHSSHPEARGAGAGPAGVWGQVARDWLTEASSPEVHLNGSPAQDLDFDRDFFAELFFLGTFAPFFRASDSPIAIACLRLFTLPP
jgi:hypothetical protein